MQTIFIATDRDGCCFAYYAGKPLWDGSDFGVGYGNQFNRYHGPNMPPPGECWEYRLTRKGDIDTDGDPIGWKIVGIGKDGSVLCEKGNGQRRRYLFGDGANGKPIDDAEQLAKAREVLRDIQKQSCKSGSIRSYVVNSIIDISGVRL